MFKTNVIPHGNTCKQAAPLVFETAFRVDDNTEAIKLTSRFYTLSTRYWRPCPNMRVLANCGFIYVQNRLASKVPLRPIDAALLRARFCHGLDVWLQSITCMNTKSSERNLEQLGHGSIKCHQTHFPRMSYSIAGASSTISNSQSAR